MTTVPTQVEAVAENFRTDIPGATVDVEPFRTSQWKVTVTRDRVTMWVTYEPRSRGRLLMKNSNLLIGGVQVPRAASYEALLKVFAEQGGTPAPAVPAEPVTVHLVDEAPRAVRMMHRKFVTRGIRAGQTLSIEHQGRDWFVCLTSSRAELRIKFIEELMHHTRPLRERIVTPVKGMDGIGLIIGGEDKSALIEGKLPNAVRLFAAAHDAAPPPAAIGRESDAATRTKGVEVRNTTVIRT